MDDILQGISSSLFQMQYYVGLKGPHWFQPWMKMPQPRQYLREEWLRGFEEETYIEKKEAKYSTRSRWKKLRHTSKQWTYLLMKVDAFDQRKRIARARISTWHTNVSKWYSSNSKSTQIAVATPSTPAETFLSLHRKTSAAVKK